MKVTGSGRWHAIHPSEFPHEQEALEFLRERLPDSSPFRAWSNFEFIAEDGSINEVDALVASTECIYLIEIKHWAGTIDGTQSTWIVTQPSGRERVDENPLLLANRKAKKLKSLLERQPAFKRMRVPFIQAAVFLSSRQCRVLLDEIASQHIYLRPDATSNNQYSIVDLIQGRVSTHAPLGRDIERAFNRAMDQLGLRKRNRAATVGDYRLIRLIAENDSYQDWEAQHLRVQDDRKRIRIFPYAQKAPATEKRERKDIANREYELLHEVNHEHILSPKQLTEAEAGPALVYDYHPEAQRLHQRLDAAKSPGDIAQRLDIVRQIAETLDYAHQRGIYHRALSPWTIEITEKTVGKHRLFASIRDWQSGSSGLQTQANTQMTLHLGELAGVIDNAQSAVYSPPEVISGHGYDPINIDMFSLGALTYAIFSGQHPASDIEQMLEKCRNGPGLMISGALDGATESLQLLIQSATDPDPSARPSDMREFLSMLDDVEDELTTPEPELGVDPTDANTGDTLTGGFVVIKRLGTGSTCTALSVNHQGQTGVLKVAKDLTFNERLRAEAETLQALRHANITRFYSLHEIDGRVSIFMEQAGERTLGQRVRKEGALSLDLLQRFGDELINTLVYLEREGINHRDIKPENIGIGETGKRALTLKLFDFSLSNAPLDNIRAGTPPYLDPFLSQRRPQRWDLHAERFAAGMTLHELATGTLPTWGSVGQDPASSTDDVSLDIEKLDASVRDSLAAFFAKVLHRDHKKRFDNADEMYLAWKTVFKHIDQTTLDETEDDGGTEFDLSRIENLNESTSLSVLGLSARELNAADRLGATTVKELVALSGNRFYRNRGIGQQVTRRLRALRDLLAAHLGKATPAEVPEESTGVISIDRLLKNLESIKLDDTQAGIIGAWLGHGGERSNSGTELPTLREVAETTGNSRPNVQNAIDTASEKWLKNGWMTALRDEVAEFISRREGIITLQELATRLLTTHGSTESGEQRLRRTIAVIQAALECEAGRESARFVLYRGESTLLVIATTSLGRSFKAPPAERAEYATALANQARKLATQENLSGPQAIDDALSSIASPKDDQALTPDRRLRLAVAAAPGVALSSRHELYPIGLSAERALRLGGNALFGAKRLSVEQLHSRIQSRFNQAEPLPDRPALDQLLTQCEIPLTWHEQGDGLPAGYAPPAQSSGLTHHTSTFRRMTTARHEVAADMPDVLAAQRFDDTLQRAMESRRVLIVSCGLSRVEQAAQALSAQFKLDTLSLDRLLIDTLRAQAKGIGADWDVVRKADRAAHASNDWRRLIALVQRAMPHVVDQLRTDPRPLIIQHLGLLVRYEQVGLIQTLRDFAVSSAMPARLLLVPGDSHQAPMLDGVVLPVITPADWTHLPKSWLENRHRAASAAAVAGNST